MENCCFPVTDTCGRYVTDYRRMKRSKKRTSEGETRICNSCGIAINKRNWSRHQRAHAQYGGDMESTLGPQLRPTCHLRDDGGGASTVKWIIRRVMRRLYPLECLNLPDYAQVAVLQCEFPTLTARDRQICLTAVKTLTTAFRNEVRVALPAMRCNHLRDDVIYLSLIHI